MRQGNTTSLTSSGVALAGGSMSVSFNSDPVSLISVYAYSIQLTWASGSTPVGTFKLQGSLDSGDNGLGQGYVAPTHWTDITSSSQSISGTPGSIIYDVTECSYRWVRLVYTSTSGSATIGVANINVKGI